MIYLVSKQKSLFKSDKYQELDPNKAIDLLSKEKILGADTETTGLDPIEDYILTIQLGTPEFQIVWDCTTYPLILLKDLLEDKSILFIWHNATFDQMWLLKEKIVQPNYYDTMIAERIINNGRPIGDYGLSLKECSSKYCGYDMDKSARGEIITKGLTERTIVYSATDTTYLIPIYNKQLEILKEHDLYDAVKFETQFTQVTAYFKLCGTRLDVDRWKNKMSSDESEMRLYEKKLNEWIINFYENHKDKNGNIVCDFLIDGATVHPDSERIPKDLQFVNPDSLGLTNENLIKSYTKDSKYGTLHYSRYWIKFGYRDKSGFHPYIPKYVVNDLFNPVNDRQCNINWSSTIQVIPIFEILGFNINIYDKKEHKYKKSVGAPIIKPQKHISDIADIYLKYKDAETVVKSFGIKFLNALSKDGRIHADWRSIGTDTFRMSCKGFVHGVKINLQQLPKDAETRACFISKDDNLWVSIDMAGQESRIMASLANDTKMIDLLNHGDIHSYVAKESFSEIPRDEPIENIKQDYHQQRQDAKSVEFTIAYAGEASTIAERIGCTIEKAQEIYDSYMKAFPKVKQYQNYCKEILKKDGYILMNNVTRAKCFIPEWDRLAAVQEQMKDHSYWNEMKQDSEMRFEYAFYRNSMTEYSRQAINYRIQNRGSCCFKMASLLFFRYIISRNLLGVVLFCIGAHDEINFEAPKEIANDLAKVYQKCVLKGSKLFCPNIDMLSDISYKKDGTLPNYWIH